MALRPSLWLVGRFAHLSGIRLLLSGHKVRWCEPFCFVGWWFFPIPPFPGPSLFNGIFLFCPSDRSVRFVGDFFIFDFVVTGFADFSEKRIYYRTFFVSALSFLC